MISEDHVTQDWSNDAENTAVHHRNKFEFNIYSHRKQLFEIVIIFYTFSSKVQGSRFLYSSHNKLYRV